jgi:hypothetical protein
MGFHKKTYFIAMIPAYVERTGHRLEHRTGWTNEGHNFGFFNNGGSWTATDLRTGRVIVTERTRKACVEWIEAHADKLEAKFATKEYAQWVADFEQWKKEEENG